MTNKHINIEGGCVLFGGKNTQGITYRTETLSFLSCCGHGDWPLLDWVSPGLGWETTVSNSRNNKLFVNYRMKLTAVLLGSVEAPLVVFVGLR